MGKVGKNGSRKDIRSCSPCLNCGVFKANARGALLVGIWDTLSNEGPLLCRSLLGAVHSPEPCHSFCRSWDSGCLCHCCLLRPWPPSGQLFWKGPNTNPHQLIHTSFPTTSFGRQASSKASLLPSSPLVSFTLVGTRSPPCSPFFKGQSEASLTRREGETSTVHPAP